MSGLPFEPITPPRAAASRRGFPLVQFGGWSLMEHPDLRYDEVIPDRAAGVALVGEIKHVAYLMDIQALKKAMRDDLRRTLSEFAARVGVAYPLEDR